MNGDRMPRPKRIYLQGFCDECGDPLRDEDITWCVDDIGCSECGASDLSFVRESEGEGVVVEVGGQRFRLDDASQPALLAALLEDAGAEKIHATSSSDGQIFHTTAFSRSAWLLPIPEGAEE